MFGSSRKNRAPAQPLTKETANPNAATAAASAFMRRDPAPTSLSSAAAAAALKARPTTPTNVSEAPSKRSTRRSESVSSTGSRGRRQGRPTELRRSPSTGSMTERTFRSPSPSPGRAPAPRRTEVPPVPSLPRNTQRPASSHNGSGMTLNTQPFRTASQKQKDGQSGSWFGGPTAGNTVNMRKSDAVLQQQLWEDSDARPGSVSPLINFSRPLARMDSPTHSDAEPVMVYDANSRRMVPKVDLTMRSQSVRNAAEQPVKKKDPTVSRSGSHLAKGNVARTKGTALQTPLPASRDSTPPARRQTPVHIQKELSPAPSRRAPEPQLSREQTLVESESDFEEEVQHKAASSAAPIVTTGEPAAPPLRKQPSVLLEEPEPEEETEQLEQRNAHSAVGAVPTRSSYASTETVDHQPEAVKLSVPDDTPEESVKEPVQKSASVRRARVHSESPARSAHFAPTTDQLLLVRHEPPPRSLSPRKSALKNASSARGASPSDDNSSEASGPVSTFNSKDEQARKKSVRVSFNDDSNVVVGEAAEPIETDSPMVPSPQTKKSWHSVFTRSKKDTGSADEDETMSPRPTLPLFGSVRTQKPKDQVDNERPLVRPSERAWSPPPVSSPLRQSAAPEAEGPSSDSAIGSILSSEASSKNEANISRAREPLPPVVTSAEGMAYDSSSFMSTDDEFEQPDAPLVTEAVEAGPIAEQAEGPGTTPDIRSAEPAVLKSQRPEDNLNGSAGSGNASDLTADKAAHLPSISITNPSPAAVEESKVSPDAEYFDVPGGFPDDDETPTASRSAPALEELGAAVPDVNPEVEPVPSSPTRSTLPMGDIKEEEENTDTSSIYSDAYEDMSDADEGGFMSLDAVLTAPADSKVSKLYQKTKRKSQEHKRLEPALDATEEERQKKEDAQPTENDWENAKTYWRSLSTTQRRQLEVEALEEAGEEADGEGDGKQKKKKKRKSTDRPISTSSTSSAARHPDRVYQIQPGTSWVTEEEQTVDRTPKPTPQQTVPVAAPKFRKSMRGAPPPKEEPELAQPAMRKSMRSNGGPSKPAASSRPVSHQPTTTTHNAKDSRRALSQDGRTMSPSGPLGATGAIAPTKRRGSDTSESSFTRARPQSQGFAFRSSMRANAAPEPESRQQETPTKGSSRFSLRSLSPTGSTAFRRGSFSTPPAQQTAMGGSRMRTSMRGQNPKQAKQGKSSLFGGKKEKKGKGGSRFAESSDEEDGGGRFFSSRFAESSDEEEASAPAPRAGGMASKSMRSSKGANTAAAAALGRPPVRSDSPDLPDSDDDIVQPKRNTIGGSNGRPTAQLQRSRSGRGSLNGPASPGVLDTEGVGGRPGHQRRGSFMSGILRRKKDNTSKITRDNAESAARRDTHLHRSQEELNVIRSNSGRVLHKREPSWPLPDAQPTNGEASTPQRPATSSGPPPTAKRGFLKRRSNSHQGTVNGISQQQQASPQPDSPVATSDTGGPKKKKFGALRKMFHLNE